MTKKQNKPFSDDIFPSSGKDHTIKLVEGFFSPSDAADVLLSLVNDKIKFHTVQSLNLRDGYNEDVSRSEQRILELKLAKEKIKDIIIKARNEGLTIEINSSIEIELKKPNTKI
ncbi:MAG: hypothetical protein WBG90_20420 [Saonia sp.]